MKSNRINHKGNKRNEKFKENLNSNRNFSSHSQEYCIHKINELLWKRNRRVRKPVKIRNSDEQRKYNKYINYLN